MNNTAIHLQELKKKMLSYADLKDTPVIECEEVMTPLIDQAIKGMSIKQIGSDMQPISGNAIYVRQGVKKRLNEVTKSLNKNGYTLQVVYGYRSLDIQQRLYDQHYAALQTTYRDVDELIEATHQYIAVPDVAGHPTGGAVDVQIIKDGAPLDFGTKIWEFCDDSMTYTANISSLAKKNRHLLRSLMMSQGFAPFDGEWWHFSYGDKEWATYYSQPHAIYSQLQTNNAIPMA